MIYYQRNLLVLALTSFLAACSWNQIVPFLPLFIKELGVDGGLAFWSGVVLAAQTIATIVMTPYWGKLADKYGRKLMIIRAGICLALIYLGMSYCQALWQLLLLRVLNGILTGFIPSSVTLVATNTPKTLSARYVALIQSAVAFGMIAGPSVGSILANWAGYRGSMMVSFYLVAVAVLLVYLLVDERQKVAADAQATSLWQDFGRAFRQPALVTAMASDLTNGFVMMASQPILILYLQQLTGTQANLYAGPLFSLPGLAVVLTNYYWCRIGERRGFPRVILAGLTGLGIFTFMQGMAGNVWLFAGCYFGAGIFSAAVSPNTAGLVATRVAPDFQGRAFAIQQSSRNLGSFIAPLLAGSLGSFFPFQWVFIIVGALSLAALLVIRIQMRSWTRNVAKTGKTG
ncbi:MAG: MFS transporter [Bacillota bacterium]|jgi:DHA1 family multidrug resistance protein-like MFS transporter